MDLCWAIKKMLYVNGMDLSHIYEGNFLVTIAWHANNHLFDVIYALVSVDNKDD